MRSLWNETVTRPAFPTLESDTETDVLIIGGGIAGILTAYFLQQNDVPYVLVEKDRICGGTTGNTTAKITFQHGLCYHKMLQSSGLERADMYLQANRMAFGKYAALCREIDCGYEIKNNYVYATDDRQKLEDEISALSKIGYNAVFAKDLPLPVNTVGAVCFEDQAQFHPLRFLYAIAKGLNIYEHTFVREMEGTTAVTDRARISAGKVIATTHFPMINKHGSYFLKLYQHRSYVMALENAQNVDGMYVDESRTGFSFRNYGDLLLLGGGGHRTGKSGGNWDELRQFAREQYPRATERYFWAAQDCMTLDGVPYIGQYAKNTSGLYVAAGFNKWGMTSSMVAALLLTDCMLKRNNPWAQVFAPNRTVLRPQLAVHGWESAASLLTPTVPRCPHMGCALKYNPQEHSWDCPCHGSRFQEDGKLIDNPATDDKRM